MNRIHTCSRLIALLFALLLTALPVAAIARENHVITSSSATSAVNQLDLPAMALTQADLDRVGLDGFGLAYGEMATAESTADRLAEPRGGTTPENTATYARLLSETGWQRTYESGFSFPRTGDPSDLAQRFRFVVTQFAGEDGAAQAFAVLTDTADITAYTVDVVPLSDDIADSAILWRYDGVRQSTGAPFHALELHLRLADLTAAISLDEFGNQQPDVAAIEALAATLVHRIQTVRSAGEPGLSASALRFTLPTDADSYDNYARLAGQDIRFYGESAAAAKRRAATYPATDDIYIVYETLAVGGPEPGDDVLFRAYVYQFATESAASAFMKDASNGVPLVDDAPTFGDESYTCVCGEGTSSEGAEQHGFGTIVRVGTNVALFDLYAAWDLSLETLSVVAGLQVACLADGQCLAPAPIPNALQPGDEPIPSDLEPQFPSQMTEPFPSMIAPEDGRA